VLEGEKNRARKRSNPTPNIISTFFASFIPYNKNGCHQKQFEEDLVLFIAKELVSLSFVKASFLGD
jgi:hypothetical protein